MQRRHGFQRLLRSLFNGKANFKLRRQRFELTSVEKAAVCSAITRRR